MDVSPNALRKETIQVLNMLNQQIDEVVIEAEKRDIRPTKLADQRGSFLLAPLLLAKAQCLATLTLLNEQGHDKKWKR